MRRTLMGWCDLLPQAARPDVERRLWKRKPPSASTSAFWELYLYVALRRRGLQVTVHTPGERGGSRLDFAVRSDRGEVLIEALSLLEEGDVLRRNRVLDDVARQMRGAWMPGFMLSASVSTIGSRFPGRIAGAQVRTWLEDLLRSGTRAPHEREFQILDCRFAVCATPCEDAQEPPAWIPVHGPARTVFDEFRLHGKLVEKVGKYGSLDAPLVIAVHVSHSLMLAEDVAQVLYGAPAGAPLHTFAVPGARGGRPRLARAIWGPTSRIDRRRLAGVLFADFTLQPWALRRSAPVLFLAPGADLGELAELPWPVVRRDEPTESRRVWTGRTDAARWLELPIEWSRVEPP